MKTLKWSYALSIGAISCYPIDFFARALGVSAGRSFASDWILPISALLAFFLIPLTWTLYVTGERGGGTLLLVAQLLLIPFFLHSSLCVLLIIGWMSTGGL